jgi:hypothetical protein
LNGGQDGISSDVETITGHARVLCLRNAAQGRRQEGWRGKEDRFVHVYHAGAATVSVPR